MPEVRITSTPCPVLENGDYWTSSFSLPRDAALQHTCSIKVSVTWSISPAYPCDTETRDSEREGGRERSRAGMEEFLASVNNKHHQAVHSLPTSK